MDPTSPAQHGSERPTLPVIAAKLRTPAPSGLVRERLAIAAGDLWKARLVVVLAPAGSGKSTLLAHLAAACAAPVAWYQAEATDRTEADLLRHLHLSIASALRREPPGVAWTDVAHAADDLDVSPPARLLVVIDDAHNLEGTAAEAALARLIGYLPAGVVVVVGTRRPLAAEFSRLRLGGTVVELGSEDLRFRSWEVEHLFSDVYGESMRPEDLALLARRTEGWAAGLQLFHLATRGRPGEERRRVLRALSGPSRATRDYLTANALADLPEELRRFLLETSVLGRLSPALCDRYLARADSGLVLRELERRLLFTMPMGDGSYRCHEVLRTHLESSLADAVGEREMQQRLRRAGTLLAEAGHIDEAIRAHVASGDAEAARRLLGTEDHDAELLDDLADGPLRDDPFLVLARARRERAAGRWRQALVAYHAVGVLGGPVALASTASSERAALSAWLQAGSTGPAGWPSILLGATRRDPLAAAAEARALGSPVGAVVEGVCLLLAGRFDGAGAVLRAARDEIAPGTVLAAAAALALGVASALHGEPAEALLDEAADESDRLAQPWLASMARAAQALTARRGGCSEALAVNLARATAGDPWGAALSSLLIALGAPPTGARGPGLDRAADTFAELGATVLEAWARVLADEAGTDARVAFLQRAAKLDLRACLAGPSSRSSVAAVRAEAPDGEIGGAGEGGSAEGWIVRCFGRFAIEIDGGEVDLGSLRPRARSVLRLLAAHFPHPVHRDVLAAALWPEASAAVATRGLQVAVSTIRHALADASSVRRHGDAYLFGGDGEVTVDVARLRACVRAGRAAHAAGDADRAESLLATALALHSGTLLAEEGAATWAVEIRDEVRVLVVDAAALLVELRSARGDADGVAEVCRRGVAVDRFADRLWKAWIGSYDRAGDVLRAEQTRRSYQAVLHELAASGP